MNSQDKVKELTSKYLIEHFENFYNELRTALYSGQSINFYCQSDESVVKECKEKAINSLLNKEKFEYYYHENN